MKTLTTLKAALAATMVAGMLAGCGTHVTPGTAAAAQMAAMNAQSKAKKGPKASAKRPAPPTVKQDKTTRQGIAASNAANAANQALQQYQALTYQWQQAWSDQDKDNIETEMLNTLHGGLQNVESITSAQGVDMQDRRSYDIADQGLNRYDSSYRQWESTWDQGQKREVVNQMLNDMVNTLEQIRNNY